MAMKNLLLSITLLIFLTGCQSGVGRWTYEQNELPRTNLASVDDYHQASKSASQQNSSVKQVAFVEDVATETVEVSVHSSSVGTLEGIESWALAINPAIQQAAAELEALRGKRTQVGLAPNPTFGINGDDINEDGSAGPVRNVFRKHNGSR